MIMDKEYALRAIKKLDDLLTRASFGPVTLAIGGGASMVLEYGFAGGTKDVDAVPTNVNIDDLKPYIEAVARDLKLEADWLNPYYSTFTVYLPKGANNRMKVTFQGDSVTVQSLGREDVLIMKFMAGRSKDVPHIRHLLKSDPDLSMVEERLIELQVLYPKVAEKALDLFYDLTEGA